jgi:predicted AlkP superfamily phosphohydrolase/phosphomutase
VDGADHGIVTELLAAGRLPTIARLRDQGRFGPLVSTEPPITPVAWTTFLTGLLPGRHGIYNFSTNPYREGHRILSAADRDGAPIWRFLQAAGLRSVMALVPFTHPVEPVGGVVVSGYGGPEKPTVHPPEAAERIARTFPDLVSARHPMRDRYWEDYDGFRRNLIADVGEVERLCAYLIEEERPDLFCVDFMSSDTIGHLAYHLRDPQSPAHDPGRAADHIGEVYEAIDAAAGRLIEHAERVHGGPVNTLLISDHGMQPIHHCFHVNRWLEQRGHLRFRRRSLQRTRGLARIDSRLAMSQRWYPALYDRIVPYGRAPDSADRTMRDVDRWRTDAYAYGTGGPVYFGEFSPRGRDRGFQEELIAELRAEPSPFGDGPALVVRRAEEVFAGPHLDRAPDLILTATDPRILIDSSRKRWPSPWVRHTDLDPSHNYGFSGHHGPIGILAAAGPQVAAGAVHDAGIQDLAPTVLRMLGVDAETAFDGRPLDGFRPAGSLVAAAADAGPGQESGVYTDEEERAIRERISALGYE